MVKTCEEEQGKCELDATTEKLEMIQDE